MLLTCQSQPLTDLPIRKHALPNYRDEAGGADKLLYFQTENERGYLTTIINSY